MNSKAQVKGKLGHVVQIHVCRKCVLNLSIASISRHSFEMKYGIFDPVKSKSDEVLRQRKRVSTQHRIVRQVSSAYHLFFSLS